MGIHTYIFSLFWGFIYKRFAGVSSNAADSLRHIRVLRRWRGDSGGSDNLQQGLHVTGQIDIA